MTGIAPIAYCGTPAIPTQVWQSWNFDPAVILSLSVLSGVVWHLSQGRQRQSGLAGVALLAVIFISPLCALSAALFSARVVHHVMLIAVAAPLLAMAFPARRALPLTAVFAGHMVILWFWHVPAVYALAIGSVAGYWLMQISLLGGALVLWREVLRPGSAPAAGIATLLGTVAQMGLLGALIAFAPQPLYVAHFYSTEAWGFSPLEDQQLAGLIMWAPAVLPYLAVALAIGLRRVFPPQVAQ
jgi:putative membrane protein